MSKPQSFVASLILFVLLTLTSPAVRGGGEEVFKGVIADSQCAMNVHSLSQSHKEMQVGKDVGKTDGDCVWYCVKEHGGRFVLQIKSKVYKLDKQDFGREYAGRKVQITGTLDPTTNVIHVRQVELLPESGQ